MHNDKWHNPLMHRDQMLKKHKVFISSLLALVFSNL